MVSIMTVVIIIPPPRIVLAAGISDRKMMPNMMPYIGCKQLIILADMVEKWLKLYRNSVWPMAVASKASKAVSGK